MAPRSIINSVCRTHGVVEHYVQQAAGRRRLMCKPCEVAKVGKRYRDRKAKLIAEHGGKCRLCHYDKYPGALQFHHVDPSTKSFQVSGRSISLERLRAEAAKCVLLCANCHAEVEAGVSDLHDVIPFARVEA